MRCNTCGYIGITSDKFCTSCGKETSLKSSNKYCTECGISLPPENKFCTDCGTQIEYFSSTLSSDSSHGEDSIGQVDAVTTSQKSAEPLSLSKGEKASVDLYSQEDSTSRSSVSEKCKEPVDFIESAVIGQTSNLLNSENEEKSGTSSESNPSKPGPPFQRVLQNTTQMTGGPNSIQASSHWQGRTVVALGLIVLGALTTDLLIDHNRGNPIPDISGEANVKSTREPGAKATNESGAIATNSLPQAPVSVSAPAVSSAASSSLLSNQGGVPYAAGRALIAIAVQRDYDRLGLLIADLEARSKPEAGDQRQSRRLNEEGLNAIRSNDSIRAVEVFKQATIVDPSDMEAADNLGFALRIAGKHDESELQLLSALERWPRRGTLWANIAETYSYLDKSDHAVAAYIVGYRYARKQDKVIEAMSRMAASAQDQRVKSDLLQAAELLKQGQYK